MITFLEYLAEQLWTAIKLPDGTIKRGKFPHSSHEEIRDKHGLEITKDHKMGFVMVKDGKKTFMDRSEAAKHIGRQTDRADSTHLKPRDQINRDDDPFAGSYASPDQIKSNVLAMRKFGTTLEEGNPLSQDLKHRRKGIHKIIISAARKNLSNKKNEERMKTLYKRLKASGAVFKKTKGVWQNAAGEIENEKSVMAHLPNDPTGEKIVSLGHKLRRKYNQDTFIHRTPDGKGTAHNRDGSVDVYGKRTAPNVDNPYGETRFKPTKPADKQPKITFTDEPEPKSRRGSFKKLK